MSESLDIQIDTCAVCNLTNKHDANHHELGSLVCPFQKNKAFIRECWDKYIRFSEDVELRRRVQELLESSADSESRSDRASSETPIPTPSLSPTPIPEPDAHLLCRRMQDCIEIQQRIIRSLVAIEERITTQPIAMAVSCFRENAVAVAVPVLPSSTTSTTPAAAISASTIPIRIVPSPEYGTTRANSSATQDSSLASEVRGPVPATLADFLPDMTLQPGDAPRHSIYVAYVAISEGYKFNEIIKEAQDKNNCKGYWGHRDCAWVARPGDHIVFLVGRRKGGITGGSNLASLQRKVLNKAVVGRVTDTGLSDKETMSELGSMFRFFVKFVIVGEADRPVVGVLLPQVVQKGAIESAKGGNSRGYGVRVEAEIFWESKEWSLENKEWSLEYF